MSRPVFQLAEFENRYYFGHFLNKLDLTGKAVEVGTHRGVFASEFLMSWKGENLYCIDPWVAGYDPVDPASRGDREEDHLEAQNLLKDSAAILVREFSHVAVKEFKDNSLDFVYVDGCHQPQEVSRDLYVWWPKIREGGVIAGHDIVCPEGSDEWGWSIQPTVLDFADSVDRTIYLVKERIPLPWSYYIRK